MNVCGIRYIGEKKKINLLFSIGWSYDMRMTEPENLVGRQEMKFNGEYFKEMIETGIKTVTLRLPKEGRHYDRGEKVLGKTSEGDINLVVVADEKMTLEEVPELISLADGFLDTDNAIEVLGKYYPDAELTYETAVEVVMFLPEDVYAGLDEKTRDLLCKLIPENLYKHEKTKRLFMNGPIFWASESKFTIEEWILLLRRNGMVCRSYLTLVERKLREEYSHHNVEELLSSRDGMAELWGIGEGPHFEMMAMGKM